MDFKAFKTLVSAIPEGAFKEHLLMGYIADIVHCETQRFKECYNCSDLEEAHYGAGMFHALVNVLVDKDTDETRISTH